MAIHGGDLQHPWTLASGHDRVAARLLYSDLPATYSLAGSAGRRPVPLPEVCSRALKAHRAKQAAELLAAGAPGCGLVFTSLAGTPIKPDNLRRSCARVRERAGLPTVRFHDCGTAASLCYSISAYRRTSSCASSGTPRST